MITFSANQTTIVSASHQTRSWLFSISSYYWSTKAITHSAQDYTAKIIGAEWDGLTENASRSGLGYMAPSRIAIPVENKNNALDEDDFKTGGEFHTVNVKLVLAGGGQQETFGEWVYAIDKVDNLNQKLIIHCKDYLTHVLDGVWPNTKQVAAIIPAANYQDYDSLCIPKVFGTAYIPVRFIYDSATTTSTCPIGKYYYCLGGTDTTYTIQEFRTPRDWVGMSVYPASGDTLTATDYCPQQTFQADSIDYRVFQPTLSTNSADCGDTYCQAGGGTIYDPLVKFYRADTLSMTNPASVTKYFLSDIGASASLMSNTSFDDMASIYDTWGIEYNYGFYHPQERTEILASLLTCCNSTIIQRDGLLCLQRFDRTNRGGLNETDIKRIGDAGATTFTPQFGSTVEESDSGYMAFVTTGMPQDELKKTIVIADGGASYTGLTDDTLPVPYVQDSIVARRVTELWLQRKFWPDKKFSFKTGYHNLFLEVDDIITISGSDYGGSHDVIIDSIHYDKMGIPTFTVCDMKTTLEDFSDSVPAGTTIDEATGETSTWAPVISGPDAREGSTAVPNLLYGRLRIQDTTAGTNTIIIDPDDPSITLREDGADRVIIGELDTNEYGIQGNDASGNEVFKIDTSGAHIGGWQIGTNTLESSSGEVGMSSQETVADDVRFWAGGSTPTTAPFRVYESGDFFADQGTFNGTISALEGGTIGGWDITATTIQNSDADVVLDSANDRIRFGTGTEHVTLSSSGLFGTDSVLGQTFAIYNDGSPPEFAAGIIKMYTFDTYTSNVIKTADDPTAGGFALNNYGLYGWDSTGTNTVRIVANGTDAGDFYAGDYDNDNAGIFYDHSAGTLDFRGTLTVDSLAKMPSDETLLGHWTFDESTVAYATDKSVYENHGTLGGTLPASDTKWVQSPRGLGYEVSTPNQMSASHAAGVASIGVGSTSFSMWLKSNLSSAPASVEIFLYKPGTSTDNFYIGYNSGTTALRILFNEGGVNYHKDFTAYNEDTYFYDQEWHHLVFVSDYDNDIMLLYVDGILEDSGAAGSTLQPDMSTSGTFYICPTANEFDGTVSDVRIYQKALTANEVRGLYTITGSYPADSTNETLNQGTTITGGGITLSGGGDIHTAGKSTYASSTDGIFVGYDSAEADYVMNIGGTSNYIKWDGTLLSIAGSMSIVSLTDAGSLAGEDSIDWGDVGDDGNKPADDADVTEDALIAGTTITGGGVTLSGGGVVKTLGKDTHDDTTPGVFLGYEGGDYTFGVGNGTNSIAWDGTDLTITGDLAISIEKSMPSDETLLGHWTFDDVAVSYVTDKTYYANHATLNGTLPASDTKWEQSPRGMGYDTSANYGTVSDDTGIEDLGEESWSFSCWAKSDVATPPAVGSELFFTKYEDTNNFIQLQWYPTGTNFRTIQRKSSTYYYRDHSDDDGTSFFDQEWHHIVTIADDPNDNYLLYIDGVLVDSGKTGAGVMTGVDRTNTGTLILGAYNGGTSNFAGVVSDMRFYNKKLSASEVEALYSMPSSYSADSTKVSLEQTTTITGGGVTLNGGGAIKTYGKDAYDSVNSGVFLGYDTGISENAFGIGNNTNYMRYRADTGAFEINQTISAGGYLLDSGGAIRTAGKSAYDDNTVGVYLGYDGAEYAIGINNTTGASHSFFRFGTTDGLAIQVGAEDSIVVNGSITMGSGSDLILEATPTDRAVLSFEVTNSLLINLAADHGDQTLGIWPSTDDEGYLYIGYDYTKDEQRFRNIYSLASHNNEMRVENYDASSNTMSSAVYVNYAGKDAYGRFSGSIASGGSTIYGTVGMTLSGTDSLSTAVCILGGPNGSGGLTVGIDPSDSDQWSKITGTVFRIDCDTYWYGSGVGIPYGELYCHNAANAITISTNSTYYQIDGLTLGDANLVSENSDAFNVDNVGVYLVNYSISCVTTGNVTIEAAVHLNSVEQTNTCSFVTSTATLYGFVLSGTGLIDVTSTSHDIELMIKNNTSAVDVTVGEVGFTIMQVGGT